jgi:hypothetical protein
MKSNMKRYFTPFLVFLTHILTGQSQSQINFKVSQSYFEENKGQIRTLDWRPIHDILFAGKSKNLQFHLSKDGIQYYFYKTENTSTQTQYSPKSIYSENPTIETQNTSYRVDVNFLNPNPSCFIIKSNELPEYSNYYNVSENTEPVLNVKKYERLLFKNIWDGVDLKYYFNNDGNLESDWIIENPKNYTKIQYSIKGALLSIDKDKSLIMKTPFGTIKEGALKVFQNNVQLKAEWIINGEIVSFHIEDYNPSLVLIIDPPTIGWSTFWGGSGTEQLFNSCSDFNGNIYVPGSTTSNSNIATVGAHQQTYQGSRDAVLIKFNNQGDRVWSTYYGGTAEEIFRTCSVDSSNNLYACGFTSSTTNIASAVAHQTTKGIGIDGFLVKFNANGVRQWGTYYGGNGDDYAHHTLTSNGNVYITGSTRSTNQIATAGAHQTSNMGNQDCFLAKFNSNGVRLWGTYYGGSNTDGPWEVQADSAENLYMCGLSNSTTGIATSGSHQASYGGGSWNAFIIKFNSNGVRQWGTYYGTGSDGTSCAVNGSDLYMTGYTNSSSNIASGGHQNSHGGGDDAFLVKFNLNGVRQWATYYGGSSTDIAYSCVVDKCNKDRIIIGGYSASDNNIATSNAFQTNRGGGNDAFFAVFNSSGARLYGTYIGGLVVKYLGEERIP